MQEEMNKAMATLSETVGEDVPTFEEVRDKIEARYAKAKGASELTGESVESRMLEVEQAAMNTEANARLAQIRSELGLAPAAGAGRRAVEAGRAAAGRRAARRARSARGPPNPAGADPGQGLNPAGPPADGQMHCRFGPQGGQQT